MRNTNGPASALRRGVGVAAFTVGAMLLAMPAGAHHLTGGAIPSSGWKGFLSGLAHPVLGLDHFAFVVAAGLIAALHRRGVLIPVAFAAASLVGTSVHGLALDLPAAELMISLSVILFGVLLLARQPSLPIVVGLASVAGIFHGYGYGESIVGAGMGPFSAYLLGLAVVQIVVALAAQRLFLTASRSALASRSLTYRWAGVMIACIGLGYLGTQVLG
jgi:urease accessory protein